MSKTRFPVYLLLVVAVSTVVHHPALTDTTPSQYRQFRLLNRSDVQCNDDNSKSILDECFSLNNQTTDCLIEEIVANKANRNSTTKKRPTVTGQQTASPHNALHTEEWNSLANRMQELAEISDTDDQYPDWMRIQKPPRELRSRICPVRYTVMHYEDSVPALIVHAKCVTNEARVYKQDGSAFMVNCADVMHFRQVYQRQRNCWPVAADRDSHVYLKSFVKVTVGCAAKYK